MNFTLILRVLKLANPYKRLFITCILLGLLLAPVSSIRPYLINKIVDDAIANYDASHLINLLMVFTGLVVLSVILRYFFIYLSALLGQLVNKDLRVRVFDYIIHLKMTYFDKTPIGSATTRTINDIEAVNDIFSKGIISIVSDIVTLIVAIFILFYTNVYLAWICIIVLPLLIWVSYIFKEKVKSSFQKIRSEISNMNAFLQERISGMRIVQIFNIEKQELDAFGKINRKYTQSYIDIVFYYAVFFAVVELISALALAMMIYWGVNGFLSDKISIGAIVAFPMYLNMLIRPIRQLANKFNELQNGLVAANRVFDLLDNNEFIDNKNKVKLNSLKGNIKFDHVYFAYDDKNYVLKDINFEIQDGETVAIVGNTGSGKSSIINILNRFYKIDKGTISINNQNIDDIDLKSLRSHISLVLQDVFLFSGTVMDNIRMRDQSISELDIIKISKELGADEFLGNLPNGYDYQLVERGANLSMGQRQLISFVRAIIFNPHILILDEATSSLDTKTEKIIQLAIEKIIQNRTSIVIAHRFSTIRHADRIIVLDKGEIVETGTHMELLTIADGFYTKLYNKQHVDQTLA